MPIQVLMPALSPTMKEGNLVKWLKAEGDTVKAGQILAEIETDKATMEVEAVDEGILGKILVPAGTENVPVNKLIALILEEGETADDLADALTRSEASPAVASEASAPAAPAAAVSSTASPLPSEEIASGRIMASPLAKRMAAQQGVDLRTLQGQGSGPHGRIIKEDVLAALSRPSAPLMHSTPTSYGEAAFKEVPLNTMRKTIAKRLSESKREVPHFYLSVSCDLDALLKTRADINQHWPSHWLRPSPEHKISVNDLIIRAVALALQKVPEANVTYHDSVLRQYNACDVAVAVAIDGGLITPVIRSAEKKSLPQLSLEMKELAARARKGKLKPEEYQGGAFTISNLGMYGVESFSAILNPPQACILAVGAGEARPVVRQGQIQMATQMTCTLSVDHRAIDGALAAILLKTIKELIEAPAILLV